MADLREQLRGEAARIMELQRKAFDSKLVSEAAQQVRPLHCWVRLKGSILTMCTGGQI